MTSINIESINIILQLSADQGLNASTRRMFLDRFALINGWTPSSEIEPAPSGDVANAHIVMDHGLDYSVVISFLKHQSPVSTLSQTRISELLSLSYNNSVDWHLFPSTTGLTVFYVRKDPVDQRFFALVEKPDAFRSEAFDILVGRKPSPNVPSLTEALVETVSKWKRRLRTEIGPHLPHESISALINSIILARALEDYRRRQDQNSERMLLSMWNLPDAGESRIMAMLETAISKFSGSDPPDFLFPRNELRPFDALQPGVVKELLSDFYIGHGLPYRYDFFVMSKQALSRICEHYVSILKEPDSAQSSFLPETPNEVYDSSLGSIYTPQYVAKFFARYLSANLPPIEFSELKVLDPACGSGMFPRCFLESMVDPGSQFGSRRHSEAIFQDMTAIDIDANACRLTVLSLTLLHLASTGRLPASLNVFNDNALTLTESLQEYHSAFDVVVTNPPFVPWDKLEAEQRAQLKAYVKDDNLGRLDTYIAFLELGIRCLSKCGYLMYVLPQSFLLSNNSSAMREKLATQFDILTIVDLSQIDVFHDRGAYVVLLIAKKRVRPDNIGRPAVVAKVRGFVGQALQDTIDRKLGQTPWYEIIEVSQGFFAEKNWAISSAEQMRFVRSSQRFPPLSEQAVIKQGVVTGADDVFIIRRDLVPKDELTVWRPLLRDKDMQRHIEPKTSMFSVFYPHNGEDQLAEEELRQHFPWTWGHLRSNEAKLKDRKSLEGRAEWWRPTRMRDPNELFRPKIVTPHLILLPKFGIDTKGKFAVTRSPFLLPRAEGYESDWLYYMSAILNSSVCARQLSGVSHKYGGGYLKLEIFTLAQIRVPLASELDTNTLSLLLREYKSFCESSTRDRSFDRVDAIITELYG